MAYLDRFHEIWAVDFEFRAPDGERPHVVCLVAIEYRTGRRIRMWEGEFGDKPPFRTDDDVLFLAFFASAELGSFRALGWADPANVLDLWIEHARAKNNRPLPPEHKGKSLLAALRSFGLDHLDASAKKDLRGLIMNNTEYTAAERVAILDYCESDVVALNELFPLLEPHIDWPRAIIRGSFMRAVADMEWRGVPMDEARSPEVANHRLELRAEIIERVNPIYHVYDGETFSLRLFGEYLYHQGLLMEWPRTETGSISTASRTMRTMAKVYPFLDDLREVMATTSLLKNNQLAIGADGRNRTILSPFSSKTSRCQPSNSKFVFGLACWLRALIKPRPGRFVAYVDWAQQELGIAAALSGDPALIRSYQSGDPYLEFAKMAKAVPADLTKQSLQQEPDGSDNHKTRAKFKQCALAVQYGMGAYSLARSIKGSYQKAQHLLLLHKGLYRQFWRWSDAAVNHVLLHKYIDTRLGWRLHLDHEPNVRSLANFPCQANGAEMMRVAAILMLDRGVPACCPVHDAFLIEGELDRKDEIVAAAQKAMGDASEVILDGFRLETDVDLVAYPNRYMDKKRGRRIWETVCDILDRIEGRSVKEKVGYPP